MKQLLVMILISGAIGWITNWVAIKMLFRPHREINFGLFKIQGLIPKRRAEIGTGIAKIVQNELISVKDVISNIDREEFSKRLNKLIDEVLNKNLKRKVKEKFPLLQVFFTDKVAKDIGNAIKGIIMENKEKIFEIFSNYAEENIDFEIIISDKISNFSLDKLEEIITLLAKKELKHIEVIGAVLGMIIGAVQYLITLIVI
ncbi:DUF445 family protein [Fusobacterium nucleatum subsp. nucleatum ATCC 23726]|mgnify:FL=1|uniref:DUF445 domain-containing protein n=3 Tax=Fusobacterium nucleatum subsp. nucleatum TaxID=76856 RepID=Q8RE96_FUSNN|nr:DUF445 family protein [Fusobacterium nucleatum]AAL95414.1 unknown [Fusobacterium nucleatum subsp. nucleatum ATCC 25586]ALF24605.1 hypothetical protein RO05_09560 [Fusobacterium nucleatum subsp. nucleatum ChDC F316]ALF25670.1 hypothetical protein RN95_04150 [Fusobacterium nucleatum subsp. nucleatum]ASG26143.1 DUF445 domain-containing protein [Fusobacterium nucleatum subsp. nucleatum]AVQ15553.1 DUF445 domain-containing protein [Fusobacterium nucleatum subsp. nucleatum ATCC 25586]